MKIASFQISHPPKLAYDQVSQRVVPHQNGPKFHLLNCETGSCPIATKLGSQIGLDI